MKKAFTIVELIIVLSTIAILAALIIPAIQAARNSSGVEQIEQSGDFQCVKTYVFYDRLYVNLKPLNGENVRVFQCSDINTFAQFIEQKYYKVIFNQSNIIDKVPVIAEPKVLEKE